MLAIIQARLGSKRLPGKVLMKINGKPLLAYMMERLMRCTRLTDCIIAMPEKDAIPSAVACPGDENDVLKRFRYVLTRDPSNVPPAFIRLCADSPLIDPVLVDWMIGQYKGVMLTNTKPRTFPAGQCVEIIPSKGFIRGITGETDEDREHVTPWIYRTMNYTNVVNPIGDFSGVNMCVDTIADFDRMETVIGRMTKSHWEYGWRELVYMYNEVASEST